jgi:membrane protease YdiL (CAAX protease family)
VTAIRQSLAARIRQHPQRIRDVMLSFAGILIFAGFIHHSFPLILLAIGGLAITALIIVISTKNMTISGVFGISRLDKRTLIFILAAIIFGVILGVLTRNRFELGLLPLGLTGVALTAPLVGACEELLFRGYIQGHTRPLGIFFSIVIATSMHTIYKLLIILTLALPLQFDFLFLIFWTFIGGLLFGILRELSGSSIPPVIAHAIFDVVVYGGLATAPVWVWS